MITSDLIPSILPPPGRLLVRRREMPVMRGLIIIPDGFNTSTRSNEAEVFSIGSEEGCKFRYEWKKGDGVFLSPSVSRHFECEGGVVLWLCSEAEIIARIVDDEGEGEGGGLGKVDLEENAAHLMEVTGAREVGVVDGVVGSVVEGDQRGLR